MFKLITFGDNEISSIPAQKMSINLQTLVLTVKYYLKNSLILPAT